MKKIILYSCFLIFFLFCIIFYSIYDNNKKIGSDYDFNVYFFNAGKADSMLITYKENNILIDTGEEDLYDDIDAYLKNNNISTIDYLIITHFDKDHVGSASSLINNYSVKNVFQSNYVKESVYYSKYIESIENNNIIPITVSGDYELDLNDLKIVINGPDKVYDKNESNNSSLIVSFFYKDNSFLFMGDSQNARISDFIDLNDNNYDFIKIPYHGNYLKKLDGLLSSRNIKYAVITSSNKELEDPLTIEMLKKYNIKYYLTRDGSIKLSSNGKIIKFYL